MWSTWVDSESPYSCGHFDTKIEVVIMKNNRAIFFFNAVNPKCNLVGGEPLHGWALIWLQYVFNFLYDVSFLLILSKNKVTDEF